MVFNQLHKRFRLGDFIKYERQFKAQRAANVKKLNVEHPVQYKMGITLPKIYPKMRF